jgi:hypothetical protein
VPSGQFRGHGASSDSGNGGNTFTIVRRDITLTTAKVEKLRERDGNEINSTGRALEKQRCFHQAASG